MRKILKLFTIDKKRVQEDVKKYFKNTHLFSDLMLVAGSCYTYPVFHHANKNRSTKYNKASSITMNRPLWKADVTLFIKGYYCS